MTEDILLLMAEAVAVYLLVLWVHSLCRRFGSAHFFALMGGITAIMSWVTDAGLQIQVAGLTFMVGSTVFYTSLLLGVFVVYVFDGPGAARTAILVVAGVSVLTPLVAAALHLQMNLGGHASPMGVPVPSFRINSASVLTTVVDLIFLAVAWESLGRPKEPIRLWLRLFFTLLGVMWLDVILFATGAFAGHPAYLSIMQGTLISRFIVSVFACPILYAYVSWQNKKVGGEIEKRPVLAILMRVAEMEGELSRARREIERRKKAEEALRESEEKLRMIIDHSNELFFLHDREHRFTYISSASMELLGYTPEEMMIKWTELATDNPINKKGVENSERAISTGQRQPPYLLELERKDGSRVLLEIDESPVKDAGGRVVAVSGAARNVTEKKVMEDRLRRSERGFRELFNSITDLIYTQDLEGRFISVNRAMARAFGCEAGELIGRRASEFMMPKMAPLFETEYLEQLRKRGFHQGITSYFTRNGEKIYIDYRSTLVTPDRGEPYITGTGRDVTDRIAAEREIKRLQEQMVESQKMEAVAALAGGIAHKFNNALSSIIGNTDLLEMEFPEDLRIRRYTSPMRESAHQMAHLSSQLLAYARGGKYNPEIVSPVDLVRDTLPLMEHVLKPGVRVETDLPLETMCIKADIAQMQMVLSAIIANSNDAIEDEGRIRITVRDLEVDEGFSKRDPSLIPGPHVSIAVEDDGRGMDEETRERIFEPFFTTHFTGRGLGMAAAYGIVKNHDGLIVVDSQPGKGTRVAIYLPTLKPGGEEGPVAEGEMTGSVA